MADDLCLGKMPDYFFACLCEMITESELEFDPFMSTSLLAASMDEELVIECFRDDVFKGKDLVNVLAPFALYDYVGFKFSRAHAIKLIHVLQKALSPDCMRFLLGDDHNAFLWFEISLDLLTFVEAELLDSSKSDDPLFDFLIG